jgi:hypothetical protein
MIRERLILGGNVLATGVFAFADLSANFNGMRFWNHMLQKRDDVMGKDHNVGPYIECQDGKWVAVKGIDFREYIDASMDESINCSTFATNSGLRRFNAAIKLIDPRNTCPMDPALYKDMLTKYKKLSQWLINPHQNNLQICWNL